MNENKEGFFSKMKTAENRGFEITMFIISIAISIGMLLSVGLLIYFWNSGGTEVAEEEDTGGSVVVSESAIEATAEPSATPYDNAIISDYQEDDDSYDKDLLDQDYGYTTSVVNLRTEPALTATVAVKVPSGTKVKLIKMQKDEWMKVEYEGTTGYIKAMYLSASKPVPIQTVVPVTTEAPTATRRPTVTAKPTKKPQKTKKPAATKKPKPTVEETEEPIETEEPVVTEAPPATEEPVVTEAPKPTNPPATEAPAVTEAAKPEETAAEIVQQ